MRLFVLAVAAGCLAVPAMAQTAASTDTKPVKEKKICRRTGPATGSIMSAPPVCHTKAEWTAIDDRNGQDAGRMLDDARGRNILKAGGGL